MPLVGFPVKYEMQGGWTIPKGDLKYLSNGPLASEGLSEILVPHALGWQRFLLVVKQFGPVLVGLISIVGVVVRYWAELAKVLNWLQRNI